MKEEKRYRFQSRQTTDLYLQLPVGSSGYRMVKPGDTFVVEGRWDHGYEEWIHQGLIHLIGIEEIEDVDPRRFLTDWQSPPHKGKYRSIDDR